MSTKEFDKFWEIQKQRRQKVASMAQSAGNRKSKFTEESTSRRPAWAIRKSDYLKPGDDTAMPMNTPTRVRILPSSSEVWYHYMNCWVQRDGRYNVVISNSHNGDKKVPDVLYYYAIQEENGSLWAQDAYAMSILILEDFYKVMKTSASGKTYPKFIRSLGSDANGKSLDSSELLNGNHDMAFGRKLHWTVGKVGMDNFEKSVKLLQEKCAHCKEGVISTYGYSCPDCKETIASHKKDTIPQQIEITLRDKLSECQHCGAAIHATPLIECVKKVGWGTNWTQGCDSPTVIDLSEIDLIVQAVPAGKGSSIEILDFVERQDDERIKNWMDQPFNMEHLFGTQPLEEQARAIGRDNPFTEQDQVLVDNAFVADSDDEDEFSVPVNSDDKEWEDNIPY